MIWEELYINTNKYLPKYKSTHQQTKFEYKYNWTGGYIYARSGDGNIDCRNQLSFIIYLLYTWCISVLNLILCHS